MHLASWFCAAIRQLLVSYIQLHHINILYYCYWSHFLFVHYLRCILWRISGNAAFERQSESASFSAASPQHCLIPSTRAHTWRWTLTQALHVSYLIRINTNQEVRRLHHGTTWGCLPRETWYMKHSWTHGYRKLKDVEGLWVMTHDQIIKSAVRIRGRTWNRCLGVSVSRCLGPWQLSFLHSPECGDCSSRREGIEKIKKRATDLCFFADTLHTLQQKLHILTLSYLCPVMPCHAVWSESGPPPFHCYIRVTGLQMNACVCVRYSHRNRYKMIQWIQLLSLSGSVSSPTCLHGQLSVRKQK